MPRRVQDPIAQHSASLCEYMNGHPTVVLSYARYFGEYPAASKATMTAVDQDGFDICCQDSGEEREVRVTFGHSMHAVSQVKDALMALAKEAKTALQGNDPNGQGLMPDSPSVTLPDLDLVGALVMAIVLTGFYLHFLPNTTSPALQWVLKTVGATWIYRMVVLVTILHCVESTASLYFTVVIGNGFFGVVDIVLWFVTVLFFGYPSLFPLIALANRQRIKARTE